MIARLKPRGYYRDQEGHIYPESDGKPMADNTIQAACIFYIFQCLEAMFGKDPLVFYAADLFWYPVLGKPDIKVAPDVLFVQNRPKGHRGSYLQFNENGIPVTVVFEVLSEGNTRKEMDAKRKWYQKYGVQEYYEINPYHKTMRIWIRQPSNRFKEIKNWQGFQSPIMNITFDLVDKEIALIDSEGKPLVPYLVLLDFSKQESIRADKAEEELRIEREKVKELFAKLQSQERSGA